MSLSVSVPRLDRVLAANFLENVPYIVYFKDREGRFLLVSKRKARRHGFEGIDALRGKSDADFFGEHHVKLAREEEREIMRTGEGIVGRVAKIDWPDGRVTWAKSTKLPLRDSQDAIIGTFGLSKDITAAKANEQALEKAHRELVAASHAAGKAEIATGVLHNVGNVLNSLNVSASLIAAGLRQSKAETLQKISAMLREQGSDVGAFLTTDPKGARMPELLASLSRHFTDERARLLKEVESMQQNLDHIKEIVSMQQAYATMVNVTEPLAADRLMVDSLRMNGAALERHEVKVVRVFQAAPPVLAEKAKVIQILVNLIRNAKYAADDGGRPDKQITLRVEPAPADRVRLIVQDNGVGIPSENLTRIFNHGFTTRALGHGFGLHSSAQVARAMHGSLTAHSDGLGHGATFTLELPAAPAGAIVTSD